VNFAESCVKLQYFATILSCNITSSVYTHARYMCATICYYFCVTIE